MRLWCGPTLAVCLVVAVGCKDEHIAGPQRSLNVQKVGRGSVTSQPAGIDCDEDCPSQTALFRADARVLLRATPARGYQFDGWLTNDDCSDGALSMTVNRVCTAQFSAVGETFAHRFSSFESDTKLALLEVDDGYVIAGEGRERQWLLKVDEGGGELWNRSLRYRIESDADPPSLVALEGGDMVLAWGGHAPDGRRSVTKLDGTGAALWHRFMPGSRGAIHPIENGRFVISDGPERVTLLSESGLVEDEVFYEVTVGPGSYDDEPRFWKVSSGFVWTMGHSALFRISRDFGIEWGSGPLVGPFPVSAAVETADGLLVAGEDEDGLIWLRPISWEKVLGPTWSLGTNVAGNGSGLRLVRSNDDDQTLAFADVGGGVVVVRLLGGAILWAKRYELTAPAARVDALVSTRDGGYALVGLHSESGAAEPALWLLKIDGAGNSSGACVVDDAMTEFHTYSGPLLELPGVMREDSRQRSAGTAQDGNFEWTVGADRASESACRVDPPTDGGAGGEAGADGSGGSGGSPATGGVSGRGGSGGRGGAAPMGGRGGHGGGGRGGSGNGGAGSAGGGAGGASGNGGTSAGAAGDGGMSNGGTSAGGLGGTGGTGGMDPSVTTWMRVMPPSVGAGGSASTGGSAGASGSAFTEDYEARQLQATSDGGYLAVVESALSTNESPRVLKLYSSGNVQWSTELGFDPVGVTAITELTGGSEPGYAVAGNLELGANAGVVTLDASGDVVWQKRLGDGALGRRARGMAPLPNGGLLVLLGGLADDAGSYYEATVLVRLDDTGAVVWSKRYDSGADFTPSVVRLARDGGYVVVGTTGGAGARMGWVAKLDASGDMTWQRTYDSTSEVLGQDIVATADGGYLLTARLDASLSVLGVLAKLGSNGAIVWQNSYGTGSFLRTNAFMSAVELSDGYAGLLYGKAVVKVDATGAPLWARAYTAATGLFASGFNVASAAGDGLVMAGYLRESTAPSRGVLVRAAADGSIAGDCASTMAEDVTGAYPATLGTLTDAALAPAQSAVALGVDEATNFTPVDAPFAGALVCGE